MASPIARRTALAALLASPLLAQRRLLPVNEPAADPQLAAFLVKLREVVARRDTAALLSMLDPQMKNSFGSGDEGIEGFRRVWDFDEQPSRVWPLLDRLLAMGGTAVGDSYGFPYVFSKFPEDLDAFEYAAITGDRVRLRAGASLDAATLRLLSFDLVEVQQQGSEWWEVTTLDGVHGFVSARYVWSPVDYRLIISKNGDWKISALIAGD